MTEKRLYVVTLSYEVVVVAESLGDAEEAAREADVDPYVRQGQEKPGPPWRASTRFASRDGPWLGRAGL